MQRLMSAPIFGLGTDFDLVYLVFREGCGLECYTFICVCFEGVFIATPDSYDNAARYA
jgi:hypothetical protein